MARLYFAINLSRKIDCPDAEIDASTVAELFDQYFLTWPKVKGYILDDQNEVRKHIVVLIDGLNLQDRKRLSDEISSQSEVYIFQALSGG